MACTTKQTKLIVIIISDAHDNNHHHHNFCERPERRFVLIIWTVSPHVHIQQNIYKYKKELKSIKIDYYILFLETICWGFFEYDMLDISKTYFLLFPLQIKGWYAFYRIEETKLVCTISRRCVIGWENIICWHEAVLKWS